MTRGVVAFVVAALVAGLAVAVDAPVAAAAAPASAPSQVGPDEAADVASARVTARLRNRRIEALSERTETSVTWVNPDGSRTTELNGGPVRVRQGDAWVPVDLTLVKGRDGVIRPKAHPRSLELAAGGGTGLRDLAVLRLGADRDVAVQWSDALPEPRLEGNRAVYAEVQPGVDLVVEATRTGFEQFLVLNRKPGKGVRFTLPVRAKGLTLRTDADGNSELVDPAGTVVGAVPAAQMWDARVDEKSGGPVKPAKVKQRKEKKPLGRAERGVSVETTDVTMEPADGYLDDPGVRYPVTIDPGVGIYTYFDTFTESDVVNTDQSGMGELRIGSYNGGSVKARSYLSFDMSAFRGARILGATLWMYETWSYSCSARNWEVWSSPQVGTGTRWANQPAPWTLFATNSATLGHDGGCNPNWISTDIRNLQQAWADQGFTAAGVTLKAQNENDSYAWKKFSSAEGGAVPHIDVTYNFRPNVARGLNVSDRGDNNGGTYTRSLTPTLTFTPTDPDGDSVAAAFYVYEGDTLIANTQFGVSSGSVAQWKVPSGLLKEGHSYRFRASTADNNDWADDGWVTIHSVGSNLNVDLPNCNAAQGTQFAQWYANGSDCQRFTMYNTGGNYFAMNIKPTMQVLDLQGCGTADGTTIGQWPWWGSDCQIWRVDPTPYPGEYKIISKYSGKAIDVPGCTQAAGNGLWTWTSFDTPCQRWRLDVSPANGAVVQWVNFTVDTQVPGAPFASSTDYPNDNTWHKGAGQAGTFTFRPPANTGDVAGYVYGLDTTPATEVVAAADGSAAPAITPGTDGQHLLNVRTKDRAGNLSAVVSYAFHVGRAGLVQPAEGARVVRRIPLRVDGDPVFTHVKFAWRRGPGAAVEADIPTAHLTKADGTPLSTGFVPLASLGGTATWNVTDTLGSGAGVVQVKAVLATDTAGTGAYATVWRTVVVDPNADGAQSTDLGGGSLNLLTGDFGLSSTDAEEFGLSVSRTSSSRDPRSGYQLQRERLSVNQQKISTDTTGFTPLTATVNRSTIRGHQDSDSILVTPPATGAGSDTTAAIGGDYGGGMRLGMQAGHTYRSTGWIYVPGATGLNPAFDRGEKLVGIYKDSTGAYVVVPSQRPTVTDAWVQLSLDMTIPAGATEAFIRLYNGFTVGSGKEVYYDDLSLREITAPFGPQWDSGLAVESAGIDYTRLSFPDAGVVALESADGSTTWFTQALDGRFFPEPGAEDLTLAFDGTTYRLSEIDGTVTTFSKTAGGDTYLVASTTPPVQAATTRFSYESVDDQVRIKRAIAPTEPGIGDCTPATPARGCEAMDYTYAATTTASGTTLGDFTGQVSAVSVWTTDPATGAMSSAIVARYTYDNQGRLREVWDPRLTQPIKTSYEYDSAGRITRVTPPGQLPWNYDYGTAGTGDANSGRLLKVRRAALQTGSLDVTDGETAATVVYNVPLTRAAGGPHDLDGAAVAAWAQTDVATDATALFGPEDPVSVNTANASSPGRDGYRPAAVHYLDAAGKEVNTATPGGYIDTQEYDRFGNTVRTLQASNRALALGQGPDAALHLGQLGLAQYDTATRATWLDTHTSYSLDGLDVVETLAPLVRVALDADPNQLVNARAHTVKTFDEAKPDGTAYHLVSTDRSGAQVVGMAGDQDAKVTRYGYDAPIGGTAGWGIRKATRATVDADAPAGSLGSATTYVRYDPQGRTRESRMLDATGTDAGTTLSIYYTAAANPDDASCGNRPEWAGRLCLTRAAGAIAGHDPGRMAGELAVKRVESYTRFGNVERTTATAAGTTRTTVTTYDSLDRVIGTAITGGAGSPVPAVSTVYDSATGQAITTSFGDGTKILRVFDKLGRLTRYTDADGGWTTSQYDRFDKVTAVSDSLGTTQTFTYDRNTEPRGLLTSVTDSIAGTITAKYGPDAQLVEQGLPGGVRLVTTLDPAGTPVAKSYTRASDGTLIAASSTVENIRGQVIAQHGPGSDKTFTYDRWSRLVQTTDVSATTGHCTTRSYAYDRHTNRTGKTTRLGTTECPANTEPGQTESHTYDSADRITDPGFTYDAFGRITTTPTGAINTYYTNDLINSQQAGGTKTSWSLDPNLRFRSYTRESLVDGTWTNVVTKTNHYDGDNDRPRWISETDSATPALTRTVDGPDGNLAATTSANGVQLQLTSLHGDVMATVPVNPATVEVTGPVAILDTDEFGVPTADTPIARYGWHGATQRSTETPTGTILMGVRVYDPTTGRFYQQDPIPGGSATTYDYCNADPINCTDLNGMKPHRGPRWSCDPKHIAKSLGCSPRQVKDAIHKVKPRRVSGKRRNPDVEINLDNGDARVKGGSGDVIGNLYDEMEMRRFQTMIGIDRRLYASTQGSAASSRGSAVRNGAIVGGAAVGGGAMLWWLGKLASPLCGPAAPVCAVVL